MNFRPMTDYAQTRRDFDWQLPDTFNFGRDVVDRWAAMDDKEALVWTDDTQAMRRLRFGDIARASSRVAHLLRRLGVRRGDRVLVMLPRVPEWQIAMVAGLKLGAVVLPCIEMQTSKDIAYRVRHAGVTAVITSDANTAKFDELPVPVKLTTGDASGAWVALREADREPDDFACADLALEEPAILYYTSGSSGLPKGVLHATRGLYAWRGSATYWQALTPADLKWCTADTGWSKAGTGILFGPWTMGSAVFLYNGPFDAARRLELMREHAVTVFCAAATEFRQMLDLPAEQLRGLPLRLALSAGETVNPEVIARWHALAGTPLLDGYGQTETLLNIVNYPGVAVRPGAMGKPLPGTESLVLDAAGRRAATGEVGRLAMKLPSPTFMLGYWNDPERTRQGILESGTRGERYWITGDLAYVDADGFFFYSGRDDDIIGSAGYRIGPTEVENALVEHPAVLECAVVASPDAARGEVVKAFVVLAAGQTPSAQLAIALQEHVKSVTAPYKYPRKVEFVEALPKTPSGKIVRRILRDREFAAANEARAP